MIGIIPAAGFGKRMGTTGCNTPKSLLKAGDEVLIDRAISHMKRSGIQDIYIITGHLSSMVREHLSKKQGGLNLRFIEQKEISGLVTGLSVVYDYLNDEDSIIYCPDNYFTDYNDIATALKMYAEHRPDILVCAEKTIPGENRPGLFGTFETDYKEPVEIKNIGVSPDEKTWTSTGISIQNSNALSLCLSPSIPERNGEKRLYDVWRQLLDNSGKIMAYRLSGQRYDISSYSDLLELNEIIEKKRMQNNPGVSVIIKTADSKYLLMERDNNPGIRYPGYWALFGGTADEGESIEDAARRELFEELELRVENLQLFYKYYENLKKEYVFMTQITTDISNLNLKEGKQFKAFSREEMMTLKIRNDDSEAILYYLENYDK